jgi:hypothetical protein
MDICEQCRTNADNVRNVAEVNGWGVYITPHTRGGAKYVSRWFATWEGAKGSIRISGGPCTNHYTDMLPPSGLEVSFPGYQELPRQADSRIGEFNRVVAGFQAFANRLDGPLARIFHDAMYDLIRVYASYRIVAQETGDGQIRL